VPDGGLLAIEVDGVHHAERAVRLADAAKDASLIAAGSQVLRIPVQAARTDPERLLRQLVAIRRAAVIRQSRSA
jgi:very-short-patch-repair endonuclease